MPVVVLVLYITDLNLIASCLRITRGKQKQVTGDVDDDCIVR